MLINDCKNCRYVCWMIGIGQGVRCNNRLHNGANHNSMPLLISKILECSFYEKSANVSHSDHKDRSR